MKTTRKLCILVAIAALGLPGYGAMADPPASAAASLCPAEPLDVAPPVPAQIGIAGYCYAEADCLVGQAYCSGSNLCQAQDATCANPQGYAECDGTKVYCPTPSALSVSISCDVSFRRIDCTATPSGGVSPYSYQWSYTGTASYWDSSGNFASASWPPSGCYGDSRFDVTVTDDCSDTAADSQSESCG